MKKLLLISSMLAALLVAGAAQAGAASITNGNFESGLSGWTIKTDAGGAGTWLGYSGTTVS